MAINFLQVRDLLKGAVRKTLDMLRSTHPDETFYAFVLYDAEGNYPGPAANSEEKWQARISKKGLADSDERFYYRWSSAEWAYEGVGDEYFAEAHTLLNSESPEGYEKFRLLSFAASILALQQLSEEGVFGSGDSRIIAFFSLSDDEDTPWLEFGSGQMVNGSEVWHDVEPEWRIAVLASRRSCSRRGQVNLAFGAKRCHEDFAHCQIIP